MRHEACLLLGVVGPGRSRPWLRALRGLSGSGGSPEVRGGLVLHNPLFAGCLSLARGKSKAERGKSLVGRTMWKTARAVYTHFSNQERS